ncbi:hypothetical protein EJB05_35309, partial [Eragrostis curvula]
MVRSKDVPKKPRDPLLTPPSKLRGAGFLDEGRPGNRGGAAMSPAPASVPNYMRGTSSSDAKGGRRRARLAATVAAPASASPARRRTAAVRVATRGKVLFPEAPSPVSVSGPGLGRATCSSTLKEAKFPDALDLAPGATVAEGPAAMRVCPYTYCSLNGHAHAPAVPLRSFLASRRRLIKTQQSMKLKGVSAFRKKSGDKNGGGGGGGAAAAAAAKIAPLIDEEAVGDFFVEVYAGPRVSSDMSCSDMSLDEMDATVRKMEFVVFDRCGADEECEKGKDPSVCGDGERDGRLEEKHGAYMDSSSVCSDAVISGDFIEELPWMSYNGYGYDSLDDGISEEQKMRDDEIDGEGISGRVGAESEQKAAPEHEVSDEENISNLVRESEIDADQGVLCRMDACQQLDARDEDNILDTVYHEEPSAGKATAEEKFSDCVHNLEIPDQVVAGSADSILEEGCVEETTADQGAKDDEFIVESDGESEVTEEQDMKEEECTPDDDSEMEISEDTISSDECREDFSEEVTSRTVLADNVFEQYVHITDDSTVDDVSEQNDMQDDQKDLEIIKCKSEDACEESGTPQESHLDGISTFFDDSAQMEPVIGIFNSNDASEESVVSLDGGLNDNEENVAGGTDMEQEITGCKLEDASEGTGVDQAVENDDSACVSNGAQNDSDLTKECVTTQEANQNDSSANVIFDAPETVEDHDSACAIDGAQSVLETTKCKSEDASSEHVAIQEAGESDKPSNVSFGAHNESEITASEFEVSAICGDTENESKLTTCKTEYVCGESSIGQEVDQVVSPAYAIDDGTPNDSEVTTFESEGAQEESDVVKDHENGANTADAKKEAEIQASESGGASEKSAMPQETDGHVSSVDASVCAQEDGSMPRVDVCKDILVTAETNQSINVQIPEQKYDCPAECHAEAQNLSAEFTDAKEVSIDDICDAFSGMDLKGAVYCDPTESATCPRNKLIISRRRRTPEEEEYLRGFNPRAPNFLPLELDPDEEKVDLRHQMVDERKNAEEWMIDYALRRAVTNLAPARKKKVELLVQAFETVLPHDEDDKKSITPTRHVQACN